MLIEWVLGGCAWLGTGDCATLALLAEEGRDRVLCVTQRKRVTDSVCACMCVCETKRERQRERHRERQRERWDCWEVWEVARGEPSPPES